MGDNVLGIRPDDPVLEFLEGFEARQSDDIVKNDLELTCVTCHVVICDIEHGDTLAVLTRTALDHECGQVNDFSGYDERGKPMYRNTADGPQCNRCDRMGGEHHDGCPNA